MENIKEKIRESRKTLTQILNNVADLPNTREIDIFTQKIEEAILWSHRIVALEYREEYDEASKEDFNVKADSNDFSQNLITDCIKETGLTDEQIRNLVKKALYS